MEDVILPNGQVITGVPKGTTKDQIMEFAIKNGYATAEDFSEATASQEQAPQEQAPMPEGNAISAFYEPAKAMAAGLINTGEQALVSAKNLVTGKGVDAAAAAVRAVGEDFPEWGIPKTQSGQEGLETLGSWVEKGLDIARFPISGLFGLTSLLSGQDSETAAKIIKDVNEKGIGTTAGDITLEATDSPLMAYMAFLSPELAASLVPISRVSAARNRATQAAMVNRIKNADAYPAVGQGVEHIGKYIGENGVDKNAVDALNQLKGIAPERIQWQIDDILNDADIGIPQEQIAGSMKRIAQDASGAQPDKGLVNYMMKGSQGFGKDKLAVNAVKQGFDEGVIAAVKSASPLDRTKFLEMVQTMERAKKDQLFGMRNRASDIAGNSLTDRVKFVKGVNKSAGEQLDGIANGLKGKPVDFSQPVENFILRLEKMGIKLDDKLNPIFVGSDIEGVKAAESIINDIMKRMRTGGEPDAYALHKLKRFIDEKVTYGKTAEGLTGKTTSVLKQLRHEIDGVLDNNFPDYKAVNTTYAETVSSLDNLQKAVGGTIDMFGDNSDKAIGTTLRRLMGNTQGRINMLDSIDELSSVARRYGADFKDDINVQILFADELDSVFGTTARTSFQGSVGEGTKRGIEMATGQKSGLGMLQGIAAKLLDGDKGISDEAAFKAIYELLGSK